MGGGADVGQRSRTFTVRGPGQRALGRNRTCGPRFRKPLRNLRRRERLARSLESVTSRPCYRAVHSRGEATCRSSREFQYVPLGPVSTGGHPRGTPLPWSKTAHGPRDRVFQRMATAPTAPKEGPKPRPLSGLDAAFFRRAAAPTATRIVRSLHHLRHAEIGRTHGRVSRRGRVSRLVHRFGVAIGTWPDKPC